MNDEMEQKSNKLVAALKEFIDDAVGDAYCAEIKDAKTKREQGYYHHAGFLREREERKEAYDRGYHMGLNEGYHQGHHAGFRAGWNAAKRGCDD